MKIEVNINDEETQTVVLSADYNQIYPDNSLHKGEVADKQISLVLIKTIFSKSTHFVETGETTRADISGRSS